MYRPWLFSGGIFPPLIGGYQWVYVPLITTNNDIVVGVSCAMRARPQPSAAGVPLITVNNGYQWVLWWQSVGTGDAARRRGPLLSYFGMGLSYIPTHTNIDTIIDAMHREYDTLSVGCRRCDGPTGNPLLTGTQWLPFNGNPTISRFLVGF